MMLTLFSSAYTSTTDTYTLSLHDALPIYNNSQRSACDVLPVHATHPPVDPWKSGGTGRIPARLSSKASPRRMGVVSDRRRVGGVPVEIPRRAGRPIRSAGPDWGRPALGIGPGATRPPPG